METKRRVLIYGDTQLLRRLAVTLRDSPLLQVEESNLCDEISVAGLFYPDVILVDGAQITPEQFRELLASCNTSRSTLISIDPLTYQLIVLSSPPSARPLARVAQVIEILSLTLTQTT